MLKELDIFLSVKISANMEIIGYTMQREQEMAGCPNKCSDTNQLEWNTMEIWLELTDQKK